MLTGEICNQIDSLWSTFWTGGISNPLEVIEQITYLLFTKRLDDLHTLEEAKANRLRKPMERTVFSVGKDERGRSYEDCRWSRFKHFAAAEMFTVVSEHVFPFLRTLGRDGSTYAHHMKDARFTISKASLLAQVVDLIDKVPMEEGERIRHSDNIANGTLELTHSTASVIDGISGTSSLIVGSGATLNLRTGLNANESLVLGAQSGTVLTLASSSRIGIEVGTGGSSSQISLSGSALASHSGTTSIDVYGLSGSSPNGPAIVINAPAGGLLTTNESSDSYVVGNVYNNTNFTVTGVNQSDTQVALQIAATGALTSAYWKGGFAGNANVWAISDGANFSNWASDQAGTDTGLVPGSGTDVFLSVNSPTNQGNMVLGANMSINSLTINSTSGTPVVLQSTGGYTLTIGGAAAITTDVDSGTATINTPLALTSAAPTILVNGTNPLTLAGKITGAATSLTKADPGTLVLSALNAQAGQTLITGGILSITNGDALGAADGTAATGTVVSAGGSLELSGNIAVDPNELLNISGTGSATNGALRNLIGNNTYGGLLSLSLDSTIQSDAGLLTLSNPGAITGAFNLTVAGTGNTTISSIIGTAAGTLTKSGNGLLTVNGANTFTGVTAVNGGTVSITNAAGLGATAGNTTVASGTTVNITNASSAEPENISGTGDATVANLAAFGYAPTGVMGALNGTGFATQSGTVTLAADSTIGATSVTTLFTVSGVISGGFNLTVTGPGVTQFTTATNSYGGTNHDQRQWYAPAWHDRQPHSRHLGVDRHQRLDLRCLWPDGNHRFPRGRGFGHAGPQPGRAGRAHDRRQQFEHDFLRRHERGQHPWHGGADQDGHGHDDDVRRKHLYGQDRDSERRDQRRLDQ